MATTKWEKLIKDYEEHCKRIEKATTVNINEKPVDKMNRIKRLESDYISWFEYYFPNYAKKPCAWYHREMAMLIIFNKILSLLGEIYRSGAKSVHLGMGIPLFLYFTKDLFYMLLIYRAFIISTIEGFKHHWLFTSFNLIVSHKLLSFMYAKKICELIFCFKNQK